MAPQSNPQWVFPLVCTGAFLLAVVSVIGFRRDHRKFVGGCLGVPLVLVIGGLCYAVTTPLFGMASGAVTAITVAGGAGIIISWLFQWIGSTRPYWRKRR